MKRYLLCLLTIAAIVACSKGEDEGKGSSNPSPDKSKTEIKIETPTADFSTEGGNNTISFTSSEAWTAQVINSRADEWISIHPTSGDAGDATITVITQPNDTPDNRTATIVIKAGAVSKNITVSQKQKDALTVTASKFEVAAEGGEVKIEVKANINFEYTIEESAMEWVKYESTRALKTSTLTFSVAENGDFEKREAKIYITSGEFNEAITIYQEGSEPSIVISKNEYVVSADGETIAVTVKSNIDVAVELPTDVNWVTENTTRGVSTNTYYFDIAPSEEYDQRTAEILFTNKENNLSEVVTIVQTQRDAIVVAKNSYTIDSEGGQIQIEVAHNVDFDVEINCGWITPVQTRALVSDLLTFAIEENVNFTNREGVIKIISKDKSLYRDIKILQEKGNTNIESPENGGNFDWE